MYTHILVKRNALNIDVDGNIGVFEGENTFIKANGVI